MIAGQSLMAVLLAFVVLYEQAKLGMAETEHLLPHLAHSFWGGLLVYPLLLGLLVRRRAWHEYVTLFVSVASILFGVGFLLLQTVFDYPILVERDFFLLK